PTASGGTNLGPTSAKLLNGTTQPSTQPSELPTVAFDGVKLRTVLYAQENGIDIVDSSQPINGYNDNKGNYDQVKMITAFNYIDMPLTCCTAEPLPSVSVPASSSGLDPHISVANAEIQAQRIADMRKIAVDRVKALIAENTDGADLGILGDPGVNVLKLN